MHHQFQHVQQKFELDHVSFEVREHLMVIIVDNDFAYAEITTHGGHLLSFQPKQSGQVLPDWLWLSPTSIWDGSKPLRGGVPICWPWFGAHPTQSSLPAHGFVRNAIWHVDQIHEHDHGVTEVILTFDMKTLPKALQEEWPHEFNVVLTIELGKKLAMTLSATNMNDYDVEISEAFHTYFAVGDCEGVTVKGLQGLTYADKLKDYQYEKQTDPLVIHPPIDRVYLDHQEGVTIGTESVTYQVDKVEAASTVVWNPGSEGVKAFADIPDEAWSEFLCVEPANALDNKYVLPSGATHHMQMIISAEH